MILVWVCVQVNLAVGLLYAMVTGASALRSALR
jgi:hypothetical protein